MARVRWSCPNCTAELATRPEAGMPMHGCSGMRGLLAPMVRVPAERIELPRGSVRTVAVERGDYVAGAGVQTDGEGRPVMAVRTDRADGSFDTTILAPVIRMRTTAGEG